MKKFFLLLLLIVFFGFIFVYWAIYLPVDFGADKELVFSIKRGEGAKEISINLQKQGLVKLKSLFRLYVLLKGEQKNLKAGKYLLSKSMNVPEIVEKFVSGRVIKNKITIIEGWNLRDIADYFESKGLVGREEFFAIVGFPAQISRSEIWAGKNFDFLEDKPRNVSLEGYLFPDTYEIPYEASLEEIIELILFNFDKKLTPDLRQEIKKQNKSIFDIITMASLLEKEVKTLEDKKIVSGILWKRLKLGMPLQVDATITYITGKKTTKISKEETEINSFYNTYKYQGLPLGPIANPGLESIKAAIYPKESPYLYYLSTPEGKTIFSKTLEEHNIAKAKYLR